jgi:hypothetical protein
MGWGMVKARVLVMRWDWVMGWAMLMVRERAMVMGQVLL